MDQALCCASKEISLSSKSLLSCVFPFHYFGVGIVQYDAQCVFVLVSAPHPAGFPKIGTITSVSYVDIIWTYHFIELMLNVFVTLSSGFPNI